MPLLRDSIVRTRWRPLGTAWILGTLIGCGAARRPDNFVWVDQFAIDTLNSSDFYRFGPDDRLSIQVFNHPEIGGHIVVREDGAISVPLLGDVPAVRKTPSELAREIEKELNASELVVGARVTVQLEQSAPLTVTVVGEVARPGVYQLTRGAGVAEALASAGGLTEFAHRDRLFVLRSDSTTVRVRFTYEALTQARGRAAQFRLHPHDVVVAE